LMGETSMNCQISIYLVLNTLVLDETIDNI